MSDAEKYAEFKGKIRFSKFQKIIEIWFFKVKVSSSFMARAAENYTDFMIQLQKPFFSMRGVSFLLYLLYILYLAYDFYNK